MKPYFFNKKNARYFPLIILALVILSLDSNYLSAQRTKSSQRAGEQRKAEKGLKDNRYFFYFVNTSITNFGTPEEKKLFKEAIQRDFLAQLLYMRFMFYESFKEIRTSQKILIDLYRKVLTRDIQLSRKILNRFASYAIHTEDNTVQEYLRLGYRDMKVADTYLKMGDSFKKTLYSMRLYKYSHAIKMAKHAKRYGFLSILLALDFKKLKDNFSKYSFPEYKSRILNAKYKVRRLTFSDIDKRLSEVPPEEKKDFYRIIHLDNHFKTKEKKSFFDMIWEKPDIHELKEYQQYLKSED